MRGIWHFALEVARDHGQRAAGEIAESIRQIGVIALHQRIEAKRSILPEDDLAQQEVAKGVAAKHIHDGFGAHDISTRLRHFAFFKQQPPVRNDTLGQGQSGGEQKRRPVDAMEAHNFFADHVHVGGPELVEFGGVI